MRRLNRTQRRMCIGAFTLVAAPLLLASVASACTQLKNLTANPNSGPAGATIKVAGTNYVTGANIGPVEIRLDSRSGAPIATLPVASINPVGNTISLDVVIPANVSVGYHTLIATQHNTSTGALLNGFPVRASYKVTAAASTRETAPVSEGATAAVAADQPAAPSMAPVAGTASGTATASAPATPTATGSTGVATSGQVVAAPAAPTGSVTAAASAPLTASTPAVDAATTAGAPQAIETSTPALGAGAEPTPAIVTSELMTAAAERSTSMLPKVMLAFGAAMVLLSLAASLRSGRSMLSGRRPGTLA
jgi:hypothetical protein